MHNEIRPSSDKSQLYRLTYALEFAKMKPIHKGNLKDILILLQKVCPEILDEMSKIRDPRELKEIFDQIGIDSHPVHFGKGWWLEINDFEKSPYDFRSEDIDVLLKGLNEICDLTGDYISPVSYNTVILSNTQHSFAIDFLPAHPCYIIRDWDSDEGSSYEITVYPTTLHIKGFEAFRDPGNTHFSYDHFEPRHFEAIIEIISNQIHKDSSKFTLRLITKSHSYMFEDGFRDIEQTEYQPKSGKFRTQLFPIQDSNNENPGRFFSIAEMRFLVERANDLSKKLNLPIAPTIWE